MAGMLVGLGHRVRQAPWSDVPLSCRRRKVDQYFQNFLLSFFYEDFCVVTAIYRETRDEKLKEILDCNTQLLPHVLLFSIWRFHYVSFQWQALQAELNDTSIPHMTSPKRHHRVLMVSDFFYPNFGGVENHIYYLGQCLIQRGHKVVVATHAYGNRSGVRYMTNGLKVYYVPYLAFFQQNSFPTLFGTLPLFRTILLRERITLVHGHQAFSTLCHEAIMHARTMGYKAVFTDHSLYGFADLGSIHMNKVLKFTLADVQQAICVSHTSKENTVVRSHIDPEKVFVIPNAVDTAMFQPSLIHRNQGEVVIVIISRLVYRKGADLLVEVIPEVCRLFPQVRFIIGGDGPKRVRLEEMREKYSLQERVEMLGAVPHANVRDVLVRGHIFLNSSLTEAFCIAILEAASCGLLTVSTRVGGVPEVLPSEFIVLAEPVPAKMVAGVARAIELLPQVDPFAMHNQMSTLYSWSDVAQRTETVYDHAASPGSEDLYERLLRYKACGPWAGKLFCLVIIVDFIFWKLLEWWQPAEQMDVAPDLHPQQEAVDGSQNVLGPNYHHSPIKISSGVL